MSDPPFTAWGRERMKGHRPSSGPNEDFANTNDPARRYADPDGFPRQYVHPVKFKIIQAGNYVYQLWEWNRLWREIALNKPHSEDPDMTWYGESVGRWEGDTLVVDSVGFTDSTWLDPFGHPHSEQLRVIERIRRVDPDTLAIEFTFDDPVAYTRPVISQHTFKRAPDSTMTEVMITISDELRYRERVLGERPAIPIRR